MVVYGSSQGGWFAFIMAALNPHVTAMSANVPARCDSGRGNRPGRGAADLTPEQLQQYRATSACYDSVNFARRVPLTTPAIVSNGFRDTTCPPPGVNAAFNELRCPKRIFNMVATGHDINDEYEKFSDEWIAGQLGLGRIIEPTPPQK
jgi:cephalosporin-C deacetylase